MPTVTNQRLSPSLHGQSAIVTLNADDSAQLVNIAPGQRIVVEANSKEGMVASVDSLGHSFKITPLMPTESFDSSSAPGFLPIGEITIE